MRRVVRCPACSLCVRVAGCGFVARARLWCTELEPLGGRRRRPRLRRARGARGGRRAARRRGRPTQARDPRGGVVAMPTVTIWHATWCAPCKGTIERVVPRLREEGVEPARPRGRGPAPVRGQGPARGLPADRHGGRRRRRAPTLPRPPHGGGDRAHHRALRVGVAREGGPTRASET